MFTKSRFKVVPGRAKLTRALLLCVILALGTFPTEIHAQDIPPGNGMPGPPEAPEPVEYVNTSALAYAEAFGVTEEEAVRRLILQDEMADLVAEIEQKEPQYAASWIVHEPEFGLVVSFTTPNGDTKSRKYLDGIEWAGLVQAAQSPLSHGELVSTQKLLLNADKKTDIPFESGVRFPPGEIRLYTPQPEELREYVASLPFLKKRLDYIKVVYQETLSAEETYSPQIDGGLEIRNQDGDRCTSGYVLSQNSTGKRYISTAAHCDGDYRTASTSLGALVHEHNYTYDVQVHDAFKARGVGLTNQIQINGQRKTVNSSEDRTTLYRDWVCKYGWRTGVSCGGVTDIAYQWADP